MRKVDKITRIQKMFKTFRNFEKIGINFKESLEKKFENFDKN